MGVIATKHVDIKSAVNACGTAAVLRINKSDVCVDTNSDATLRDSDTLNLLGD